MKYTLYTEDAEKLVSGNWTYEFNISTTPAQQSFDDAIIKPSHQLEMHCSLDSARGIWKKLIDAGYKVRDNS